MNTLDYILNRFKLSFDDSTRMPIEIPNFGRDNMAKLFAELDFKRGIEVGVRDGEYSEVLCAVNVELVLYGIDPYIPHKGYKDIVRKSTFASYKQIAQDRLATFKDRYNFVEKFSLDAVKDFDDGSVDFVYIDGDHSFQSTTNDIAEWSKKIRPGGIIAGHDYFKHKGPSDIKVYEVVNAYASAYNIRPWFVLGTKAVIPGEIRDVSRSWMWVK